jgi:hypothetical protein
VLVYSEACGSAHRTQRIAVRLLLEGLHEGLGNSIPTTDSDHSVIPTDTIEVGKILPQQFAITEVCWKEWKDNFVGAFIIV